MSNLKSIFGLCTWLHLYRGLQQMQHRFITFVELARTVYENRRGRMQQMICRILHFTVVAEKGQHPPAACPRLDFPPFLLTSPVALLVSPFDLFHHLHGVLSPPLYSYCGWLHVVMDMNSGYQRFVRYASSFGVIPLLAGGYFFIPRWRTPASSSRSSPLNQ